MKQKIELLDTVVLAGDLLLQGEVGTVVEVLGPAVYEVEFSDDEGQTYTEFALRNDQLIILHNQGRGLRIAA